MNGVKFKFFKIFSFLRGYFYCNMNSQILCILLQLSNPGSTTYYFHDVV